MFAETLEVCCMAFNVMFFLDLLVRLYGWFAVFCGVISTGGGPTGLLLLWILYNVRAREV